MYLFQLAVRSWQVAQNDAKAAAMCGSPLERGGGCVLCASVLRYYMAANTPPPQHVQPHTLSRGELHNIDIVN